MTNPVLAKEFNDAPRILNGEPMSITGAVNKTFILMACLIASSLYVWYLFIQGFVDKVMMLGTVGFIVGIISFIVIMFNKRIMNIMAPVYAISEGLLLGAISSIMEVSYPGIVINAIVSTFMALFVMLLLYKVGAIRCTEKFRSVLMISMFSILGVYLLNLVGSFFGYNIPFLYSSTPIGIGVSVFIVVIAALNLIIDFDFIERGAQNMLDKNYEWYGAFGIMVTLVWLYIEILNLLAKLRDR